MTMSHEYVDPRRASNPHALPDVEILELTTADMILLDLRDDDENFLPPGWYYRYGLPGCLPDSGPEGPYDSYNAALQAARDDAGIEVEDDE